MNTIKMEYHETDGGRLCRTFTDDCVVRSITLATGVSYRDTFAALMALGLEVGAYPNHGKVWEAYLKRLGWQKNRPPRDPNGKLIKLRDWADAPAVAVVRNSGHLTCVKGGAVLDTWDCRYRPVNSYWTPAHEPG